MELTRQRLDKGLLLFLGLNVADCVVTAVVIMMGGVENSWYKFLFTAMPVALGLCLKMLIAGLVAFLVFKYKRNLFKPLNIGMALILLLNIMPIVAYLVGRYG